MSWLEGILHQASWQLLIGLDSCRLDASAACLQAFLSMIWSRRGSKCSLVTCHATRLHLRQWDLSKRGLEAADWIPRVAAGKADPEICEERIACAKVLCDYGNGNFGPLPACEADQQAMLRPSHRLQ